MRWLAALLVFCMLSSFSLLARATEVAFPPLGSRYETATPDLKAVVRSLQRVEALTDVGVNFIAYDKAVTEAYPDVKIFLGSAEAQDLPELRFAIGNAMDCYLEVRRLWGQSISAQSPVDRYHAEMNLITARPMLWTTAAVNVAGAVALLDGTVADREEVQRSLSESSEKITVSGALKAAIEEEIRLSRQSRGEETGWPVPVTLKDDARLKAILCPGVALAQGISTGEISRRLPPIYSKVPPAPSEGLSELLLNGESQGGLAVFIYEKLEEAEKAFNAVQENVGQNRRRRPGLGNIAFESGAAVAFRRANVVAYTQGSAPAQAVLASLKIIDSRIQKEAGAGVDVPEEKAPSPEPQIAASPSPPLPEPQSFEENEEPIRPIATFPEATHLAGILLAEGDLGHGIEADEFQGSPHVEFDDLPAPMAGGWYRLSNGVRHFGFIAAVEYDSFEASKEFFEMWASQSRSKATVKKTAGIGSKGYQRETSDSAEIFFCRGNFLFYIYGPKSADKDLIRLARRIDLRAKQARAGAGPN